MGAGPSTPDPDYERTGRGRTEAERRAMWDELIARQAAEDEARADLGRTALGLVALVAVLASWGAVLVVILLVTLGIAGAIGLVPALLVAILVALCVIASRMKR